MNFQKAIAWLVHLLPVVSPLFALSTFDTDYVLVKEQHLQQAKVALERAGHTFP